MLDQTISLFQESSYLLMTAVTVFGLVIGSFLNVVIYRLPIMLQRSWKNQCQELLELSVDKAEVFNLATPPSRCPRCGHTIGAMENLPVVSFLMQRGKCKHCRAKISPRYPLIELLTALVSATVAWQLGFGWPLLFALLLSWALIALTFIDFDHQLLPDDITLPLIWLGLLLSVFDIFTDMQSSIIGAVTGYLSLWSVYQLFKLLTGKEGMGYGDFKLLAVFGAWFGWQSLPMVILLSSLVGAVIGVSLIIFLGRDRQLPIPFGPYLATAGWLAMLWGDEITRGYLSYMVQT
ncbi:MAG: A24 family peptidase [Chromatiales bacterium]|nr:A24 family peptidase [Chromatiales bacterium]